MINYTLTKSKDTYSLEVEQDTTFKLVYLSGNTTETITPTITLVADSITELSTLKDGLFKIILNENLVDEVEKEFFVMKYLQEDLIESIRTLLCKDCSEITSICNTSYGLNTQEKILLINQSIFNNTMLYQNYYLAQYEDEFLSYFVNYLEAATATIRQKVQKDLNTAVFTKIIKGNDTYNQDLFRTSLYIYWAGFYFTEKFFLLDAENEEELVYLSDKFKMDEISNCTEDLTINLEGLETIYNNSLGKVDIAHYQLDFVGQGIEDLVAQEFYTNQYTQAQMLAGVNITFTKIAKFGFIVKNTGINPYKILDTFNNDITNNFDYYFIDKVSYYLSKENISYATVSFKFQKNN